MLFLIAKTTAAAFNSLTFNSTPTAENIDCNRKSGAALPRNVSSCLAVITVTCCRATLVVSWPEEQPCRTTLVVVCPVAWSLVVAWRSAWLAQSLPKT